ncbi:U32 family peptidase [Enterococcus dongliensis]|uniref:U32 family peptidase n=1 Tax=Enterococcus dongliensis TaxID=2559925 RepID=A0AAW8TEB2_9ENTE|nr:peptidase U32 family protein [Enterococcus dongliensis]MDT2596711.1 U32 family peptidase [Enterococcus dongliensis]MDT2604552.1 U32 family peptidase [Enterococcus dongliensis]MDT2635592.1 U32 family peptidase [Enterococcus dongliensis]MDT2636619.1 U32 family peptidase [Enterococcus dongliensis]MDT2640927.1 U32 family peptidase [Enterococcus dongliensis]
MIDLIATAESVAQAEELLAAGVDTLYIGEEEFGLRLAHSFSREEQRALIELAHAQGKKVNIAVNGIMHTDKMKKIPEYLAFLAEVQPDNVVVGDTGVIYLLQEYDLPYIYDAETLVTNARQINFWQKRGAVGAVLAREVPFEEMQRLSQQVTVPVEILVYGATCIHQSKRPLLDNYFNYTKQTEDVSKERGLFISEPKKPETHYSIYEDLHGTHVFADNDLNLINELSELNQTGYQTWKLDGLFTPGEDFVAIAKIFVSAKKAIEANTWNEAAAKTAQQEIQKYHPVGRGMDTGFYHLDPTAIK